MFGLTTREQLSNMITRACVSELPNYKSKLLEAIEQFELSDEDSWEEIALRARCECLNNITDNVFAALRLAPGSISARLSLALMSPSVCGLEYLDENIPRMAGWVYAIGYYALTGKVAKTKDCILLNHVQGDLLNCALIELDNELAEK